MSSSLSASGPRYEQLSTSPSEDNLHPDSASASPQPQRDFSGGSDVTLVGRDIGSQDGDKSTTIDKQSTLEERVAALEQLRQHNAEAGDAPARFLPLPLPRKNTVYQAVRKVSDSELSTSASQLLEKSDPHIRDDRRSLLTDWWLSEIGAAFFSLACMAIVFGVLFKIHGEPLSDWSFPIMPNSLISIFLTLAKTALLLPVAESITQLKWLHFEKQPHRLSDMQLFDDASKGPWGAVKLLWCCGLRGIAIIASLGAVITLLTLAMDPFAQQILTFPSRLVPDLANNASVAVTSTYGDMANNTPIAVDFGIQRAVFGGLFSDNNQAGYTCPTGNCTMPHFTTLGVCEQCTDVSKDTTLTCSRWAKNASYTDAYVCDYNTPSGASFKACSLYGPKAPVDCFDVAQDAGHTKFTSIASINPNMTTLLDFAAIHIGNPWMIKPNVTLPPKTIMECTLSWCAKSYTNWTISNGFMSNDTVVTTAPLVPSPYNDYNLTYGIPSSAYVLNGTLAGVNETDLKFDIAGRENGNLKTFLANVFTNSLTSGNASSGWPPSLNPTQTMTMASALYRANGGNIRDTISALAKSLDAEVRQGRIGHQPVGAALRSETYIRVEWPWLIMPTMLVIIGIAFLVLSLIQTSLNGTVLWKSSTIAPLFHGLEGYTGRELNLQGRRHMEAAAEGMQVQLKPDDDGKMRFVRSASETR